MTIRYPLYIALVYVMSSLISMPSSAAAPGEETGYVARQESLRTLFEALSVTLGKPIVVSKLAAQKKVTGTFVWDQPERTLAKITAQLSLIWYSDGQSVHVYDASESKNVVGSLNTITVQKLLAFLRRSGLEDARYPVRNDGLRTFYVSGPPVYVDLITHTAQLMDSQAAGLDLGQQRIGVIRLQNTFVGDRKYDMRDESIVIPGMATVIEALLTGEKSGVETSVRRSVPAGAMDGLSFAQNAVVDEGDVSATIARDLAAGNIRVIAYPDTNSLLVKGLPDQVLFIENLVAALDEAKRHVELSLWIIDLQKDDLNQLGVNWQGSVKVGQQFSASLNGGPSTTLDGASFMMQIMALERQNRANVVSRPIILTQENVPAVFDNNRTFYTELVGERAVDLQHVTYGTMVNVLPRFVQSEEIEMSLTIEDGNEVESGGRDGNDNQARSLPTVGRTRISTVARVPQGKSLLVGGFTRDESGEQVGRIPLLGAIPVIGRLFSYRQSRDANTVRVFLIQPREIRTPLPVQASELAAHASDFGVQIQSRRAILKAVER